MTENRKATPPSPSTTPEADERAAFEAWAVSDDGGWFSWALGRNPEGHEFDYRDDDVQAEWRAWQARAALASRPAEVDDGGLPPLPASAWSTMDIGLGSTQYYTAEQYRQGQRDAVAADRARRGGRQ